MAKTPISLSLNNHINTDIQQASEVSKQSDIV